MIKLKPCPFCGGEAEIKIVWHSHGMDGSYKNHLIQCKNCYARKEISADNFYGREAYTEQEAIAAWNRRAGEEK